MKCPLCHKENNCSMIHGSIDGCWCLTVSVPSSLLKLVKTEDGCICRECIDKENIRLEGVQISV